MSWGLEGVDGGQDRLRLRPTDLSPPDDAGLVDQEDGALDIAVLLDDAVGGGDFGALIYEDGEVEGELCGPLRVGFE